VPSVLRTAFNLQLVQLFESCPLHDRQLLWQVPKEQSPLALTWNPLLHWQVPLDWREEFALQEEHPKELVEVQVAHVFAQLRHRPLPSTTKPELQVHVLATWLKVEFTLQLKQLLLN